MVSPLREHVTVQANGRIEICSSHLPPGARAEVIVILESPVPHSSPLQHMIGKGRGVYATPEEADQFIRQERDAWES